MKIVAKPRKEKEIRGAVSKKATQKKIVSDIVAKSECCVDHLCGCK